MSTFELIEYKFDPDDFSPSLEDQFQLTRLTKEIESCTDAESLRQAAVKLLQLSVHRQAVIRSLVKRLANLEAGAIRTLYPD